MIHRIADDCSTRLTIQNDEQCYLICLRLPFTEDRFCYMALKLHQQCTSVKLFYCTSGTQLNEGQKEIKVQVR